jgi:ethanolamine utilization protein EutP (predicted NTPase)
VYFTIFTHGYTQSITHTHTHAHCTQGIDYESDEDEGEDPVPYITKKMLMSALSQSKRSVTERDLEKYLRYKRYV